jgi:hypothetical protein
MEGAVTITINQDLIFIAIFLSICLDVFFKPFIKVKNESIKRVITRVILLILSTIVVYLTDPKELITQSIALSVLSMIFYDVSGYKILKNAVKKRLGDSLT